MTDTTNHADVIRQFIAKVMDTGYHRGTSRCEFCLSRRAAALAALDALTRELDSPDIWCHTLRRILMADIRAALPTSGSGRTVKDLRKRGLGTEIEINNALAEMLDRGEVRRNGKRWIAVETTVELDNGLIVKIQPQPPKENLYPVICEALEDQGFSRYQGHVIRRRERMRIQRIIKAHE